ncbi:hypothetical protein TBLA_0B05810 [Henningerozyma blattae CBS 6284]|uniref:Uncharacterized protein n=1 Tax=Henningerozyma blattae (strain ATCC 34711 / CBS 6284 / DSM 70876 / NBRC 10599 / NRRL Y-10934 / UCD 77-7) TaxID=1071380 RepID=I2GZ55_HENB6|nr:hypothetical protein TBLA_0B05810 [Tetrapisispora blattae CBS 6284]CCH59407.1 hypothetical protein TBLA_0B05810 [Tetrapisispora blattae CBS 6284]
MPALPCKTLLVNSLRSSARAPLQASSRRWASAPAVSKALLADLPARWDGLQESEQDSILTALAERQKLPWSQLTSQEQQAAWYISYGSWGPRRPVLARGDATYIARGTVIGLILSLALFAGVRSLADEDPRTMTKEWQLKSDEYLKSKNANPWGGYSQVQSK